MKQYLCFTVLCLTSILSEAYEIRQAPNMPPQVGVQNGMQNGMQNAQGVSVKCHQCFQAPYCAQDQVVECTYERVMETAQRLSFIRDALPVMQTASYYCTHYTATYDNNTSINVQGCLYNSFNPCDEKYKNEQALKWNCKYCNLVDGCNPANKVFENLKVIGSLLSLVVFCVPLIY